MKAIHVSFITIVCGVSALCSCGKEVLTEDTSEANSHLTILTRGIDDPDDAVIVTPVRLYVFSSEGKCVTVQTMEDEDTSFSIDLPEGTYSIYAVGGADNSRVTLPAQEDASKTSVIQPQRGKMLDDLTTGHSTVTLSANGTNLLTLGMERKVMCIKHIVIKGVPSTATDVSVSISPVYESFHLDGSWQGENGSITVPMTRQADGSTWKESYADIYSLPSVGKPTITVNIGNSHYSYTCAEELTANYKIYIEGQYTENHNGSDVRLSGTMKGVTWAGEKSILFSFDETGSKTTLNEDLPEAGSIYEGCYVLAVDGSQVTLLSPKEVSSLVASLIPEKDIISVINATLKKWKPSGYQWRLPTINEIKKALIEHESINLNADESFQEINALSQWYLCTKDNGTLSGVKGKTNGFSEKGNDMFGPESVLRPVTTITIQ